ncbi:tyrosine-type recombinase/integrase [Bradyrhizobium japonicum]|uniref:tyrosine-type recombinase/integrase n=1 Tax=Bradyrhizobium japonicum TaxID=375 RepID=UPI00271453E4|nr:tyrosine-type recombinase/integrase [Bradyrhizobium japonicum]WLB54833.1 tyrosine-type recombinase/integrase [Bradyrhizobium japonicum]WLB63292.1 tyrosine-type recombinase/integrase [Bradyrhizobium japonicum]
MSKAHFARAKLKAKQDGRNPLNDALCAYHHAGRNGPNPLEAELVLREPRPSVARKPGRREKKQGTWYISNGPTVFRSTGCSEKEWRQAQLVLQIYQSEEIARITGARMPGNLTFDEVLADHVATLKAEATTRSKKRHAQREEAMCKTLLKLQFGGRPLSTYVHQDAHDFKAKLVAIRQAHHEKNGLDPDLEDLDGYPASCLYTLDKALKLYPGRHGQFWCMPIYVPPRKSRRRTKWLTKQEVIRLLLACLGYMWDPERCCWMTKTIQKEDGSWVVTRRVNTPDTAFLRQGMSRLIRFILRTGVRHEACLRMKWGSWSEHGSVKFDDAEGNGWIYRRGEQEYNTNKSLGDSEIYEELRVLLRIWAKQDGYIVDGKVQKTGKKARIIRDEEDKGYDCYCLEEFRQICAWAGVDTKTTIHALKHTCATWLKQRGFSDDAISEMTDTSVSTLKSFYMHVSKETRARYARREFDDRAKRREWRLVSHNDNDPTEAKRMRDRPRMVGTPTAAAA